MTAPDVITTTLAGQPLAITYTADFGETIISSLLLALLAVLVLNFIVRVTRHERNR